MDNTERKNGLRQLVADLGLSQTAGKPRYRRVDPPSQEELDARAAVRELLGTKRETTEGNEDQ